MIKYIAAAVLAGIALTISIYHPHATPEVSRPQIVTPAPQFPEKPFSPLHQPQYPGLNQLDEDWIDSPCGHLHREGEEVCLMR